MCFFPQENLKPLCLKTCNDACALYGIKEHVQSTQSLECMFQAVILLSTVCKVFAERVEFPQSLSTHLPLS